MINILLSVRQPFSGLILDGKKTIELRKNHPKISTKDDITLWIYESGKGGEHAIVGKCRYSGYASVSELLDFRVIEWVVSQARVEKDHLMNYAPCYGWLVRKPVRLPAAVPLSAIGLTRPPQSWQYITPEQAAILEQTTKTCEDCMKTCVGCRYWSGWTGECTSSLSGHTWEEMDSEHPACDFFKPEEIEQEAENEDDA